MPDIFGSQDISYLTSDSFRSPELTPDDPYVDNFGFREEKLRSDPPTIRFPLFLPYYDMTQSVFEDSRMRHTYRQMLNDPNIAAPFQSLILSVAANELNFHPYQRRGEKLPDERNKEIADFTRWDFEERIVNGIAGMVWDIFSGALMDGYSVCEKVWDVHDHGMWNNHVILRDLKPKDTNQDLVLNIDAFRNIVTVQGLRYNAVIHFPPSYFLIYSHLGLFKNPTGRSAFRAVYSRYWLLDTVLKLRGWGCEKKAFPFVWAEWQNPSQQSKLEAALAKIKRDNWASVPPGVKLNAIEVAGRSDDMFDSFCRSLREEIVFGLQGATLQSMTGGDGAKRGSSDVHKDTADLWKWHLCEMFKHLLNNYDTGLIRELVDYNYANVEGYPKASVGGIDSAELAEDLNIDKGLQEMGYSLSKLDIGKRYGREEAEDEGDMLQQPGMQQSPEMVQNPGLDYMNGEENGNGTGVNGNGNGKPPNDEGKRHLNGDNKGKYAPYGVRVKGQADGTRKPKANIFSEIPENPETAPLRKPLEDEVPTWAGIDGPQAEKLLQGAMARGEDRMMELTRSAVTRLISSGPKAALRAKSLFTPEELADLTESLQVSNGMADLLGRSSIRLRQEQAAKFHEDMGISLFAPGNKIDKDFVNKFTEEETELCFGYGWLCHVDNRREILGREPQTEMAMLPGWTKSGDNIVEDDAGTVTGVVFRVTKAELEKIDQSER
jgi:hypothetical protein